MMCGWFQRQWKGRPEKESYRSYFLTALSHALQIKERTLLDKLTILICLTDNHMERTSIFTYPGSPSLGKAVSGDEELEAKASASFQRRGEGRHHGHDPVSTQKLSRKLLLLRV